MVALSSNSLDFSRKSLVTQVQSLPWGLILMICAMAMIGVAILHSATFTNPEEAGLPMRQATRFAVALVVLLVAALVPIRWWFRAAWPSYLATVIL
mgnify:FL=1